MKSKLIYKLLAVFLLCSLLNVVIIGALSYRSGKELLKEQSFMKLAAVKASKAQQIEAYFETIRSQVLTMSDNRMIVDAMENFKLTFHEGDLLANAYADLAEQRNSAMLNYYEQEFYSRLTAKNDDIDSSVEAYIPSSSKVAYWQYQYIAGNPHPTGEKLNLLDAGDGSAYSFVHKRYHPNIKNYLEQFGYYDIFLVDDETGHIVYSVFKEVDYGTSLLTGPYSNTNFAAVFKEVRNQTDKNAVVLKDFEPYSPSYGAPASFIASPIFKGDKRVGVLIFQMPVDEINAVLTSNESWRDTGMGESGETYIVGHDNKMRSISRFLIEDPENYFAALEMAGYPGDVIDKIKRQETSILYQSIFTKGVEEAKKGQKGIGIIKDYRDVDVLSSYIPLAIEDVDWYLLSEIDTAEAFAPISRLFNSILIAGLAVMFVVGCISIFFARSFVRPIDRLKDAANKVATGNNDVYIQVTSSDEIGQLGASFNTMVTSIKEAGEKVAAEQAQTKAALDEAQGAKLSAELALQEAEAAKEDAMKAKAQAEESRTQVEEALEGAEQAKAEALKSKETAEASAKEAQLEKEKARVSEQEAQREKEKAKASEEEAERAMKEALESKSRAEKALTEADKSKREAEEALKEAEASKEEAMQAHAQAEASKSQVEEALKGAEQAKAEALKSKELAEASEKEAQIEKEKAKASEEEAARAMKEAVESKNKAEEALKEADQAKQEAEKALKEAEAAKDEAMKAQAQAEASKAQVEQALQDAEAAQAEALKSKEKAEASEAEAQVEKDKAKASEQEAAKAMKEALLSKSRAETALTEADRAKQEAEAALNEAELAKEAAIASKVQAEKAMKEIEVTRQEALRATNELEQSVELMLEKMNLFSHGDLTVELPTHNNFDINRLYGGFNEAVLSVRHLIENVNQAVAETKSVVSKISSSSNTILHDARKQANQATGIAAAAEEMTQTIEFNAETASGAAKVSSESGEVAREGSQIIKKAVDIIKQISTNLNESAALFEHLRQSGNKIGNATTVIERIADQTKLLALNARIEAEHAAEKGAGFAVVAKEVRQLAEQTTQSTDGIAKMVGSVQSDTQSAIDFMNQCREIAEKGTTLADKALQAIEKIDDKVYETVQMANQIAKAAVDQTQASNEISRNIVDISDLSQKAQEQVHDIVHSVDSLSHHTDTLEKMVGAFKTHPVEYA